MRRHIFFIAMISMAMINTSHTYNIKRGPQVIKDLITEIQTVSGLENQREAIIQWVKKHPGLTFPLVEGQNVYFVYADINKGKSPVEKVSLAYSGNDFKKNTLFLDHIKNTPLFIRSLKLATPSDTGYEYYLLRNGKTVKSIDPLNGAVHTGTKVRNGIIDPRSSQGYLLQLDAPRPQKIYKKRKVWIYLPPRYYQETNKTYPVLYMQDGQNLWSGKSMPYGGWQVKESADKLIQSGKIKPVIIVGVENSSERNLEYVGFSTFYKMKEQDFYNKFPKAESGFKNGREKSALFTRYYIDILLPWIETQFRIDRDKESRTIAGSSFGAGVSLHLAFKHPELFSGIGSLSGGSYPLEHPRYYTRPFDAFPYMIDLELPSRPQYRIFLHCGDRDLDADFLIETRRMYSALLKRGWIEGKDLMYIEDKNKGHNEKTWAQQMDNLLLYFYSK